jgi:hypothetical protein
VEDNPYSVQVAVHLSFTTLRLLLRLQADIINTLQLTSNQFTVKCTQFDRIWLGKGNKLSRFSFYFPYCVKMIASASTDSDWKEMGANYPITKITLENTKVAVGEC